MCEQPSASTQGLFVNEWQAYGQIRSCCRVGGTLVDEYDEEVQTEGNVVGGHVGNGTVSSDTCLKTTQCRLTVNNSAPSDEYQ